MYLKLYIKNQTNHLNIIFFHKVPSAVNKN